MLKNKKYMFVYIAIAVLVGASFANDKNEEQFQFSKILVKLPLVKSAENTQMLKYKFRDIYIGLRPNQILEIDVSNLRDDLKDSTEYEFSVSLFNMKKGKRFADPQGHSEFIFTTKDIIDNKLTLPYQFTETENFALVNSTNFFMMSIVINDNRSTLLSRIILKSE